MSGNFKNGTKSDIAAMIESKGGTMLKSVTKKCDYVVAGSFGDERWTMGNYGSKIKEAMDWQAKGIPVKIITEEDLIKVF